MLLVKTGRVTRVLQGASCTFTLVRQAYIAMRGWRRPMWTIWLTIPNELLPVFRSPFPVCPLLWDCLLHAYVSWWKLRSHYVFATLSVEHHTFATLLVPSCKHVTTAGPPWQVTICVTAPRYIKCIMIESTCPKIRLFLHQTL